MNEQHQIFEYLSKEKILRNGKPNQDFLVKIKPSKMIDIGLEISNLTEQVSLSVGQSSSPFIRHSASFSLSGFAEDCENYECRSGKLDSLLRFAALYSDEVLARNFFVGYHHFDIDEKTSLFNRFTSDLFLLLDAKPLIESGHVKLVSYDGNMCPSCVGEKLLNNKTGSGKKATRAFEHIASEYLKKMKCRISIEDGIYKFHVQGPDEYFEHGGMVFSSKSPFEFLQEDKLLLSKVNSRKNVILNKGQILSTDFHHWLAARVSKNIGFELYSNQVCGTSFITNKDVHINFIDRITNDGKNKHEDRNGIMSKYLTTMVPLVSELNISDLIALRNAESESFILFRAAMSKAVDVVYSKKGNFAIQEAKDVYNDLVSPKLAELNLKVKRSSSGLLKKAYRPVLGLAGVLTIGAYSGFLNSEMMEIAKVFGLTKFGSDLIQDVIGTSDAENAIAEHEFYFLWKIQQLK
jgi:hypothetical protein